MVIGEAMQNAEEQPKLLIVEDDLDLMTFLVDELEEEYLVCSATNGREGMELACEQMPDLIVTDLMMPVMSGSELCRELKSRSETSHIPVIMLTAKSAVEDQVEGLQVGADDYITKPFVLELLQARIKNLLNSRARLRERFRSELLEDVPTRLDALPDHDFMIRSFRVLEEHSADPEFSADDLAKLLAMSMSTLHRKLKSLTGETPAKLIWNVRLKRAAKLLKESDLRVTEIAFMVGYADSNHFSRQFKQQYGKTPSKFRSGDSTPDD